MKWITRERVKVDRMTCPWLIRKFIDPQAEFIFAPANQVEARACELGATPFDIDGCELGHQGEDVSFRSVQPLSHSSWCRATNSSSFKCEYARYTRSISSR